MVPDPERRYAAKREASFFYCDPAMENRLLALKEYSGLQQDCWDPSYSFCSRLLNKPELLEIDFCTDLSLGKKESFLIRV